MKFIQIPLALLLVAVGVSCSKDINSAKSSSEDTVEFYVIASDDLTKTSLNGDFSIDWCKGDSIKYYSADAGNVRSYQIIENCHTTSIPVILDSQNYLIAVCGGGTVSGNSADGFTLSNAIPVKQSGLFADAHITVAKSTDLSSHTLSFHNITSMVKFSLTRTDVSYVIFTSLDGTEVQGNGIVNISFDGETASASYGSEGGTSVKVMTNGAGTFYISMLPCATTGFEIFCYDKDGTALGKASSRKTLALNKNSLVNLGELDSHIKEIPSTDPPIEDPEEGDEWDW